MRTTIIRTGRAFVSPPAGAPEGPLPTITSDTFNRPDTGDIIGSLTDAGLGGLSIPWQGFGANALALNSRKVVRGAGNVTFGVGVPIPVPDISVGLTIDDAPADSGSVYIDFRRENMTSGQSPDGYRIAVIGATVSVRSRVGGATVVLSGNYAFSPGARVRVVVRGSSMMFFLNGALVWEGADSAIGGAGFVGFSAGASTTGFAFRDFVVSRA